jgi:hypothetical protein
VRDFNGQILEQKVQLLSIATIQNGSSTMKKFFLIALAVLSLTTQPANAQDLFFLNQAKLSLPGKYNGSDFHLVPVLNCARGFTLSHLMVQSVIDNAAISDIGVRFANGAWQLIPVREYIRQGTRSRWIDLRAGQRCVSAIAFFGVDTDANFRKARINVWGAGIKLK